MLFVPHDNGNIESSCLLSVESRLFSCFVSSHMFSPTWDKLRAYINKGEEYDEGMNDDFMKKT